MKKALQPKGIFLGILLLLMAIVSTVAVYQLRESHKEAAQQTEAP